MTKFQKIVIVLLSLNFLCTLGLYLRFDSEELAMQKEIRAVKRDIVGTRYDDTNLKNTLADLEKQVGKLGEKTRQQVEQRPAPEIPDRQKEAKPEQPETGQWTNLLPPMLRRIFQ